MKKNIFIWTVCAAMLLAGCEKEPGANPGHDTDTIPPVDNREYAYVLNEGAWGCNNAEISRVDIADGSIEADWFSRQNGRGLGDVAQDLEHYGSRLYATVYMSNTVEVIDCATGKSVKQIDMGSRGPRYITCHEGKVYVSCYDKSVVRIDTTTLSIEAVCPLSGMQPEQMCIMKGKLYVCNSWQYDNDGQAVYDSTLSVVDLATFREVEKIPIIIPATQTIFAYNPVRVKTDNTKLYIVTAGNYTNREAATINYNPDDISFAYHQYRPTATNLDIHGTDIYNYNIYDDRDGNTHIEFYHNGAFILTSYADQLKNPYGINVHPESGDLYICNSAYGANGDVYCFNSEGVERWHAEAGIYASKVVF